MNEKITSNLDVVVYALGVLGGAKKKVPTEQIAHQCFIMAPSRFSWILREFSAFPDKYVVKTALEDAAKPKYGSLVEGKYARDFSKDGWTLTPDGVSWFEENSSRIASALALDRETPQALPPIELKRFISRMSRTTAYRSFTSTGNLDSVTRFTFADMLQASPDAPPLLLRRKFDRLLSIAQLANDSRIIEFLMKCEERFLQPIGDNQE